MVTAQRSCAYENDSNQLAKEVGKTWQQISPFLFWVLKGRGPVRPPAKLVHWPRGRRLGSLNASKLVVVGLQDRRQRRSDGMGSLSSDFGEVPANDKQPPGGKVFGVF